MVEVEDRVVVKKFQGTSPLTVPKSEVPNAKEESVPAARSVEPLG